MNPYVIIGALLALAGSFGAGWYYGSGYAEGEAAKDKAAALSAAAADHNANAVIDMQAAADVEREKAEKRIKALRGRHALEMDIVRRSPPAECSAACNLDAESVELLRQRVRDINGAKGNAPGGSGLRLPGTSGDGKRGVGDGTTVSR